MDKIDNYNLEQIKRIYTEDKVILSLIRIIKDAKIDYGKNKSYIQELELEIIDLKDTISSNFDINREAKKEVKKEELYKNINNNLRSLEAAQKELKRYNAKILYELIQLKNNNK